jgi:hypothetical protein
LGEDCCKCRSHGWVKNDHPAKRYGGADVKCSVQWVSLGSEIETPMVLISEMRKLRSKRGEPC